MRKKNFLTNGWLYILNTSPLPLRKTLLRSYFLLIYYFLNSALSSFSDTSTRISDKSKLASVASSVRDNMKMSSNMVVRYVISQPGIQRSSTEWFKFMAV